MSNEMMDLMTGMPRPGAGEPTAAGPLVAAVLVTPSGSPSAPSPIAAPQLQEIPMTVNSDVTGLTTNDIPALAEKWKAWASAQTAALQTQLDAANGALVQAQADLKQAVQDHDDEVAALKAALAGAEPPAA